MKYSLVLVLLWFVACKQTVNKNLRVKARNIDTTIYSVLKFDIKRDSILFNKSYKPADLSSGDISTIEELVRKKVIEYNEKKEAQAVEINDRLDKKRFPNAKYSSDTISHPEKYFKQFIPVINDDGEKIVWVNCFCDKSKKEYWKKFPVSVDDGGSCFFQLEINLMTNTVLVFSVNGLA